MASKRFGIINVAANPHPEGIYRRIFEAAAGRGARFWGAEFCATSQISETRDGIFTGRLAVWTEVATDSNVINKKILEETPYLESGIDLPAEIGLNSKTFGFAFNENNHRLYLEMKNDKARSISINRAHIAFSRILEEIDVGVEINVTVVPEQEAVERILAEKRLKRFEVHLRLPNPDDLSDEDVKEVVDELKQRGAKGLDLSLMKSSTAKSLILNTRDRLLARVAAFNGYVVGRIEMATGGVANVSTKDHPKISVIETVDGPSEGTLRAVARRAE